MRSILDFGLIQCMLHAVKAMPATFLVNALVGFQALVNKPKEPVRVLPSGTLFLEGLNNE